MTESEMIDSLRVHRFEPGDRLRVMLMTPIALRGGAVIAKAWVPSDLTLVDVERIAQQLRAMTVSEGESK